MGRLAEILRLMSEGLQGSDGWGTVIWEHDLVARVSDVAVLRPAEHRRLELVESWDAVRTYVSASLDLEEAKQRALEVTERIQEVLKVLRAEFAITTPDQRSWCQCDLVLGH